MAVDGNRMANAIHPFVPRIPAREGMSASQPHPPSRFQTRHSESARRFEMALVDHLDLAEHRIPRLEPFVLPVELRHHVWPRIPPHNRDVDVAPAGLPC